MKLIEQLVGEGDVFKDDENLGKVNYQLYVYQEVVNGQEGLTNAVGKIDSKIAFRLFDEGKLKLRIEDGRNIEFFIRNSNGDIQCSGGFFIE